MHVVPVETVTFTFVKVHHEAQLPVLRELAIYDTIGGQAIKKSMPFSPDYLSISAMMPEGPADLPHFILLRTLMTITSVIGERTDNWRSIRKRPCVPELSAHSLPLKIKGHICNSCVRGAMLSVKPGP